MKSPNKIFILLFLIAVSQNNFSQTIGIKAGMNISKFDITNRYKENYSDRIVYRIGSQVGVTANFSISKVFSVETGVSLFSKGSNFTSGYFGNYQNDVSRISLLYVNLPLYLKTSIPIGKAKIFVAFGPYIGYGFSGKTRSSYVTNSGMVKTGLSSVKWGKENSGEFENLDYGASAGIGVELKPIQINLFYDYGIANISTNSEYFEIKNRVIGLSVAYLFGKKNKAN